MQVNIEEQITSPELLNGSKVFDPGFLVESTQCGVFNQHRLAVFQPVIYDEKLWKSRRKLLTFEIQFEKFAKQERNGVSLVFPRVSIMQAFGGALKH